MLTRTTGRCARRGRAPHAGPIVPAVAGAIPAGNRTVPRLNATLNYDIVKTGKQGALYLSGIGYKAPDKVVWPPTGDCRVVRHGGAEVSEGRAWVCQHWLSSSVVVIGVALDVGGRRRAWGSGLT